MNQKKTGQFLRLLRQEKGITQEQLSKILGVTNRSVSRWENGVNMPDFDLVMEITKYFDISIDEFLDGERKKADNKQEQTLLNVVDYHNEEKILFSKRIHHLFLGSIIAFIVYMILDINKLTSSFIYEEIASIMLGIVLGTLLVGTIYSSCYINKVKNLKMRILNKRQNEA